MQKRSIAKQLAGVKRSRPKAAPIARLGPRNRVEEDPVTGKCNYVIGAPGKMQCGAPMDVGCPRCNKNVCAMHKSTTCNQHVGAPFAVPENLISRARPVSRPKKKILLAGSKGTVSKLLSRKAQRQPLTSIRRLQRTKQVNLQ